LSSSVESNAWEENDTKQQCRIMKALNAQCVVQNQKNTMGNSIKSQDHAM